MDGFLFHVAVLELRHSADHQNCGYGRTTEATVTVKVNDAPLPTVLTTFGSDFAFSAQLNPNDNIVFTVTPKNPDFHPTEGGFVYQGEAQFRRRADTPIERAGFAPPQAVQLDASFGLLPFLNVALFQCYISNLNDVTTKVGGILSKAAGGVDVIAQLEAPETNHWIQMPPVPGPGSAPQYERRQVDPRANIRCYELGGKVVPKLVMTTWPKNVDNAISSLPGLVMFHPKLSNYYASSRYPFGKQHLWDAGLKYFGFRGLDPILSVYAGGKARKWRDVMDKAEEEMGLPHQMAAGGKRVAVVMPVNLSASIGKFADGNFLHAFCHEMNGYGLRSEEAYFDPPPLGRWALAGFSSGNLLLAGVLNGNRGNAFVDGVVAEVYAMDPPPAGGKAGLALDTVVDAAVAWQGRTTGDRRFRLYTQEPSHPKFAVFKVNRTDPLPRPAFVVPAAAAANPADPGGQRRMVLSTPPATVTAAARALDPDFARRFPGGYRGGDQEGHRLVNQTMLVDAVRRSGFPSIDGSRE
jgi:hypothetical protein